MIKRLSTVVRDMKYLNINCVIMTLVLIFSIGMVNDSVRANEVSLNSKSRGNHAFIRNVDRIISLGKMQQNETYAKQPLLHMVAKFGYVSQLKGLISIGADVNIENEYGQNVLHILAPKHDRTNIIEILINAGADINLQRKIGNVTPIMTSIIRGVNNNVKLLLGKGANINLRSKTKDTALSYAVRENRYNIVKLILENKKLDLGVYNDAVDITIRENNSDMFNLLSKSKLFNLKPITVMKIIQNGFRIDSSKANLPNKIDLCGYSQTRYQSKKIRLLDAIVKYNRINIFEKLIKSSNINSCLNESLLYSVAEGNYDAFELFMSERNKINQSNNYNKELYCTAFLNNNFSIINFLKKQQTTKFKCP